MKSPELLNLLRVFTDYLFDENYLRSPVIRVIISGFSVHLYEMSIENSYFSFG